MSNKIKINGFYFITDASLSKKGNLSDVEEALKAGVKIIQYRHKTGETQGLIEEAQKIKALCHKYGCKFLINDRVDVCLAVEADGVHLGQEDMPYEIARKLLGKNKVIGLTAHNVEEAKEAEGLGADYIGVSPLFATTTKKDAGAPAGVDLIREIKKVCKLPLVAVGGINLENALPVIAAGAEGLVAISAVVAKDDVKAEIEKFQKLFK